MSDFIRVQADKKVLCLGIMPKVLKERTGCPVSLLSDKGRIVISIRDRTERERERIMETLQQMQGIEILSSDGANEPEHRKAH